MSRSATRFSGEDRLVRPPFADTSLPAVPRILARVGLRRAAAMAATAALAAIVGFFASPAAAQQRGGRVFASPYICQQAGGYSAEQCRNAFANAQAELEDAAPRFPTREACVQYFKRCSIAEIASGKKVTFAPSLAGVSISAGGGRPAVVPVVAGSAPPLGFQPRPIDQRRTERSTQKQKRAQAAWEQQLQAPAAATGPAETDPNFAPEKAEPYDPDWRKQEGVATFPGPKARQKAKGQ